MSELFRPTVRLRLTLMYGALFFVAGLLLLTLTYGLLARSLDLLPVSRAEILLGLRGDRAGGRPSPGDEAARVNEIRRAERQETLREVRVQAAIALVFTSAGALALGWLIAGRVLSPIRRITAHARHANESTLSQRIDLRGPPDELKELADTIDAMLARLEAAFEAQRRFAAQASHELRTPLAIIRAEADVALAAADASERERALALATRDAADRSERLVDGLLTLARGESGSAEHLPLDVAEIAGDVVAAQASAASAAGVRLDLELGDGRVAGDRMLLSRLLGNLVENAIRYNVPGGWASVGVGTEGVDVVIRVANSGPVISPADLTRLWEPFQRGDRSVRGDRSGFGLGLAIVRAVALAHGGSARADAPGSGGLIVTVRLPAARE